MTTSKSRTARLAEHERVVRAAAKRERRQLKKLAKRGLVAVEQPDEVRRERERLAWQAMTESRANAR
jgi:hypothetical protein